MRTIVAVAVSSLAIAGTALTDGTDVPFPEGYRSWLHRRSTVDMTGQQPEGKAGLQRVGARGALRRCARSHRDPCLGVTG